MAIALNKSWTQLSANDNEALAKAVNAGDLFTVISLLLSPSVDINYITQRFRMPPLHLAVYRGELETARLLVDYGADINQPGENGVTPLLIAAQKQHVELVRDLLAKGAQVNHRSQSGMTALMCACQKGNQDMVDMLLDHGADFTLRQKEGLTASDLAVRHGHLHVIATLHKGSDQAHN